MKTIIPILLLHLSLNLFAPILIFDRIDIPCISDIIEEESGIKIPKDADKEHLRLMYNLAIENDIPIRIMFRLVYAESRFNPTALSPKNAYGYTQIIPSTFVYLLRKLNMPLCTPHTPELNIKLGIGYLADLRRFWLDKSYDGWDMPLASYNSGIGTVIRFGGIPDIQETINYVAFINN